MDNEITMANGITYTTKPGFTACHECVNPWPHRYENGDCWVCVNIDVGDTYHALSTGAAFDPAFPNGFPSNSAVAHEMGSEFYFTGQACKKGPHPKKLLLIGPKKCIGCPRVDARRKEKTYYTPEFDCTECGLREPRSVKTNTCMHCRETKATEARKQTVRSVARHAGEKHYTPDTPCPDCDTSERRVYDNKCVHCCSATDSRRSGTQAFIDGNPELIVTRDMARTLGFKVFRTGKPCSRGHTGFRYVTTNGCITCLRGR